MMKEVERCCDVREIKNYEERCIQSGKLSQRRRKFNNFDCKSSITLKVEMSHKNVPNGNVNRDNIHSSSIVTQITEANFTRTQIVDIPNSQSGNGFVGGREGFDDVNGNIPSSSQVRISRSTQLSRQHQGEAHTSNMQHHSLPSDSRTSINPQAQFPSSSHTSRDGNLAIDHQGSSTLSEPPVRRRGTSEQRHAVRRTNTVSGVTREAEVVLNRYLEHRSNSQNDSSRSSSLTHRRREGGASGLKHSASDKYPMLPIDEHGSAGHLITGVDMVDSEGLFNTTSDDMSSSVFNSLDGRLEPGASSRADTLDSSTGNSHQGHLSTVDEATARERTENWQPDDLSGALARLPGSVHKRKPSAGLSTLADSSARGSLTPSEEDPNSSPVSSSVDPQQRKKPVLQRIKERFRASFRRKKGRLSIAASETPASNAHNQGDGTQPGESAFSQRKQKGGGSSFRKNHKTTGASGGSDPRSAVSRAASSSTNGSAAQETVSEHGTHSTSPLAINRALVNDRRGNESSGVLSRIRKSFRGIRNKSKNGDRHSHGAGSSGRNSASADGGQDLVLCHGLTEQDQEMLDKYRGSSTPPNAPSDNFRRPQTPPAPEPMDRRSVGAGSAPFCRYQSHISTDGRDEPDMPANHQPGSDSNSAHRPTSHAFGSLQHQTSKHFGDKSNDEKEEIYDVIASRLQDIGDDLYRNSPAVQAAFTDGNSCQLAAGLRSVALSAEVDRTDGTEYRVHISNTAAVQPSLLVAAAEHSTLLQQLASNILSYDSFAQLVTRAVNSSGEQLPQQIAMLFRITTDAIELAGGAGSSLSRQLSQWAMMYFEQRLATRLVQAGGWESVVEDSSLESEVD